MNLKQAKMQYFPLRPIVTTLMATTISLLIGACATPSSTTPSEATVWAFPALTPKIDSDPLPGADSPEAQQFYQLLVGEFNAADGNLLDAYLLVFNAAKQSADSALFERAVHLAIEGKMLDRALVTAQTWQQVVPDSRDAARYSLDILLEMRHFDQLSAPIRALITLTPDEERPHMISSLGQYLSPHAKAIDPVYEEILSPWLHGSNPAEAAAAWVSVSIIKLSISKPSDAYDAVERAYALAPNDSETILAAINLIENGVPQAESMVQTYIKGGHIDPQVRLAYIQTLLQRQRLYPAVEQLELAIKDPQTPAVAWFILGSLQFEIEQTETCIQTLQTYLDKTAQDESSTTTRQNRERALLTLAQAEVNLGRFQEAQKWLDQVSDAEVKRPALLAYIDILSQKHQYEAALGALKGVSANKPDERNQVTTLRALLLIQAGRQQEAYDILDQLNTQNAATPNVQTLYWQAIAAIELDNFAQAEHLLRQVLKLNPDHADAANSLGYLLADNNTKLDEAKTLIEHALSLKPEDGAILDSLGWVEYRLGNTAKALELLQQAYERYPDPEVAAHLGEVQWEVGEREAALTTWKLSWLTFPDNATLKSTLANLNITPKMLDGFVLSADTFTLGEDLQHPSSLSLQANAYVFSLAYTHQWQQLYDLLAPITQQQEKPQLMMMLAYAANHLEKYAEAERILRRVITIDPQNPFAYNDLGYTFVERGERLDEAKVLIEKAYALAPDSPAILDSLGWLEFKLGNLESALKWLQTAYDKDPSVADTGVHLGEVLWLLDRKGEAMLVWRDVKTHSPDNALLQETMTRLGASLP